MALLDVLGWVDERVDEGVVRLLLCFIIPANGSPLGHVGSDEGLLRLWLHHSRQWFSIGHGSRFWRMGDRGWQQLAAEAAHQRVCGVFEVTLKLFRSVFVGKIRRI